MKEILLVILSILSSIATPARDLALSKIALEQDKVTIEHSALKKMPVTVEEECFGYKEWGKYIKPEIEATKIYPIGTPIQVVRDYPGGNVTLDNGFLIEITTLNHCGLKYEFMDSKVSRSAERRIFWSGEDAWKNYGNEVLRLERLSNGAGTEYTKDFPSVHLWTTTHMKSARMWINDRNIEIVVKDIGRRPTE